MGINFTFKKQDDEQLPVADFVETELKEAEMSDVAAPEPAGEGRMVLRTDNLVKNTANARLSIMFRLMSLRVRLSGCSVLMEPARLQHSI